MSPRAIRDSMYAAMDQFMGADGVHAIELLWKIANGQITVPMRAPGPNEDSASAALIPHTLPTVKERMEAVQFLFNHRYGRAPASVVLEVNEQARIPAQALDLSKLSNEKLDLLESLYREAQPDTAVAEDDVEGQH